MPFQQPAKVFIDEMTDAGGPGIFRTCGRDDRQGAVIARAIMKDLSERKLAILHDNSAGGRGLAEEVKKRLNAGGVTEVLFESIAPGEKDYSALVTSLKKNGIELIVFGGYHTEACVSYGRRAQRRNSLAATLWRRPNCGPLPARRRRERS